MRAISSRQNAIVKLFHRVARRASDDDLMLLEGARLIADGDAANLSLTHVVVARDALDPSLSGVLARAEKRGAHIASASDSVIAAASPARTSSGVVALARKPRHELAALVAQSPSLILAIVGVQDPGNVGALIRSAEASGASGIVVSGASADPFGWKALRGSMGSAFRLPVVVVSDPNDLVREAREHGIRVLATAPHRGTPLFDVDFRPSTLLIVGGEGLGLPQDLLDVADETVTIPMSGKVESLNVGVAGALLLYEAFRQRLGSRR